MTQAEVMTEADLDDDEFDDLYAAVLRQVRLHGTNGVQVILNYIEQEILEYREFIE